jgi:hypothetical protein
VQLQQTGTQTITVSNGEQLATCTVNVVASGAPVISVVPVNGNYTTYPYTGGVTVTPTYIPRLPNTGFEPQNGAAAATAAVLLIAAALFALPYVRKAFAIVLG